jgi:hypothetical protein
MRHSDQGGRFDIPFEQASIFQGIDADLRTLVGHHVQWIEFDPEASRMDEIYDVADRVIGRQWKEPPRRIPAYAAFIHQGVTVHSERGFYNTDVLRVSVAMDKMEETFPELVWEPDRHIKDRVLYRGKVFVPTQTNIRGLLRDSHTIFTISANQVNPEEYVNDPQLIEWANRSARPPQPYDPQRHREHTTR